MFRHRLTLSVNQKKANPDLFRFCPTPLKNSARALGVANNMHPLNWWAQTKSSSTPTNSAE